MAHNAVTATGVPRTWPEHLYGGPNPTGSHCGIASANRAHVERYEVRFRTPTCSKASTRAASAKSRHIQSISTSATAFEIVADFESLEMCRIYRNVKSVLGAESLVGLVKSPSDEESGSRHRSLLGRERERGRRAQMRVGARGWPSTRSSFSLAIAHRPTENRPHALAPIRTVEGEEG
jgi:hypothetical protein